MLLITPRTFLHEGAVVLGRRGFTNGPSGSDAGIGIGGRPWLQKVAALTVAISLTIATADTFKIAEKQYNQGYMDAMKLQEAVADGTELKVIRLISDTFLWLAQAQTLIRLFPGQREKIIIKWTAFALITLETLFSTLNNFVYDGETRPHSFVDAIPALSYLFQLALSLLYCAWVIYYSIMKKRFAFYHPQMRNICLVALLSLVSVIVPVVFFVLDISSPNLATWGDYVRWVGAAAASVAVWEWVERIEALERNDKKDGVLGREVFDGDEMLDVTPESDPWTKPSKKGSDGDSGEDGTTTGHHGLSWPAVTGITNRHRPRLRRDVEEGGGQANGTAREPPKQTAVLLRPPLWPTRPPPAATPVSRTDTASAESTVYAIRYHPISEATPSTREQDRALGVSRNNSEDIIRPQPVSLASDEPDKTQVIEQMEEDRMGENHRHVPWQALTRVNPFKSRVQEPPPEVSAHTARQEAPSHAHDTSNRWDIRAKIEDFAATKAEKFREKNKPTANAAPLPVTVIPAPRRRRNLGQTMEESETEDRSPLQRSDSTPWQSLPSFPLHRTHLHRSSDPYTPDDLTRHSITQRGAISFVTSPQQDRSTEEAAPVEDQQRNSQLSSRHSPSLTRSTASPKSGTGLPFVSIPAPPRQPRSPEE
ncbi:pH-response regulator palH RIM21 [Hyphodiscus hymeniophilus]|uniref:PH-response regulator palH RIM21 n=1 Tax=Hyphodiscus hymeniophilus TaxID=353542 RepID=A0A9P6VIS7_9HELO|nr:pH-response regulator palH RIM21 [Hyphodiscus hymeniophilus]